MEGPGLDHELLDQLAGVLEIDAGLRVLLDALPDVIVVVDENGLIVLASQPILRLAGYQPTELVGEPIEILVPVARREGHVRVRGGFEADARSRPMGSQQDIMLRHRDGSEIAVDISLSPIRSAGRQFVVAAVRGASQRRAAEQAVRRALEHEQEAAARLREVAEIKNAFIRAISHELRTPLTVVRGLAETLEDRASQLSPTQIELLATRLARNAQRLDGLLGDLLDIDRLTRGTIVADRQVIDLANLCREVIARSATGGRRVVAELPERLPAAVDPAQVERILENLLTNAVKYSPPDTPIIVRAGLDAGSGGLLLTVDDEGSGVPAHLQEAIFEPFFRVDDASPAPGTGVGLSLVAEFARLHGGRAWVEDRAGGGSSFRVLLPAGTRVD